jgi:hypothetical protein
MLACTCKTRVNDAVVIRFSKWEAVIAVLSEEKEGI